MDKIKVWDLPVRLFHWLLVVAIGVCIYMIKAENITAHQYAGVGVLTLIIFRIIWGIIGSSTARFSDFIKGPRTIYRYLRYGISASEGHNPLGAYMILLFMLLILIQVTTGLFLEDNTFIYQDSPLAKLVSSNQRNIMRKIHFLNEYVLYGAIGLHLAAIIFYRLFKEQRLVQTMITGKRPVDQLHTPMAEDISGDHPVFALLLLAGLGILIPYIIYGYMQNQGFFSWCMNNLVWLKRMII